MATNFRTSWSSENIHLTDARAALSEQLRLHRLG